MKLKILFPILLGLIIVGCQSDTEISAKGNYQTISALGDTLYAIPLDPETTSRFKTNLASARANYNANPDDPEAIIWYGRRMGYLGNYKEAIEIFTGGIEKHPSDARMYRHRGHRYISTRQFDKAIGDFNKAVELIEGTEDRIEPDGLPNEQNEPRSTLHTNIWYHLGLAHYLTGNFSEAINAYRECIEASENDDMLVATSYWLYMALKRAGHDDLAGEVLEPIERDMNIIENDSYHKLLLVFKGDFDEKSLMDDSSTPLDNATIGYGLGNWHYVNGRTRHAEEIFRNVYEGNNWAAFGYIAAEVDLNRIFMEK